MPTRVDFSDTHRIDIGQHVNQLFLHRIRSWTVIQFYRQCRRGRTSASVDLTENDARDKFFGQVKDILIDGRNEAIEGHHEKRDDNQCALKFYV